MTLPGILGILVLVALALLAGVPLGHYLYRTFSGAPNRLDRWFGPFERVLYRAVGIDPSVNMDWKAYLRALMLVNFLMMLFCYLILRVQAVLPLNPQHVGGLSWDLAFDTAASFITNTNWQNYAGEASLSYLSQMLAITYLQFTAAATGLVAAIAFLRGLTNSRAEGIGNFWVDFIRMLTRVLLPLSIVLGVVFVAMGVPDTLVGSQVVHTLSGGIQTIARGPVASLEAIKELGTNGGGYFGQNSAHPFENPSAWSDILQALAMAALPIAMVTALGRFLKNPRQARVLFVYLTAALVAGCFVIYAAEAAGNPVLLHTLGIAGPNMEGKEVRFGPSLTASYAAFTTAFGTGTVNAMHDSLMPISGLVTLLYMMFNLVYGAVGVGLLNILMFLIVTVFIAGLMVGRTPEIFGKKIEAREIKLAVIAMLVHPFLILVPTAIALATPAGLASVLNPGLHGFSEVLYAFTSTAANNGSAFAGLNGNTVFYNVVLGINMLLGRYVSIIAMFAIAGSLAKKPVIPAGAGTLATDTLQFGGVFVAVFVIVGALTFFPALAVGPIGEQLRMMAHLVR